LVSRLFNDARAPAIPAEPLDIGRTAHTIGDG